MVQNISAEKILEYLEGSLAISDREFIDKMIKENPDFQKEIADLTEAVRILEENLGHIKDEAIPKNIEDLISQSGSTKRGYVLNLKPVMSLAAAAIVGVVIGNFSSDYKSSLYDLNKDSELLFRGQSSADESERGQIKQLLDYQLMMTVFADYSDNQTANLESNTGRVIGIKIESTLRTNRGEVCKVASVNRDRDQKDIYFKMLACTKLGDWSDLDIAFFE